MEDELCHITIFKDNDYFVARTESAYGGHRELKSKVFEDVLEQVNTELIEEFDE